MDWKPLNDGLRVFAYAGAVDIFFLIIFDA